MFKSYSLLITIFVLLNCSESKAGFNFFFNTLGKFANVSASPTSGTSMNVTGATVGTVAYGSNVTFTFTNSGSTRTTAISVKFGNSGSATATNFEIVTDGCTNQILNIGATCTIVVRPKATGNASYTDSLVLTY